MSFESSARDREPRAILDSIGVWLDAPALVTPAARLLSKKTTELQAAYAQGAAC